MGVTYIREMNPNVMVGCLDCGWQDAYDTYEEAKDARAEHPKQCREQ